jgi:hypothetical protein
MRTLIVIVLFLEACGNPQGSQSTIDSAFHPGISAVSNYGATVIADSPSYYWRLGESSGTTLSDQVGGNTSTLTGLYTLGVPGAFSSNSRTALQLSGGFFYSAILLTPTNTFSLEFWFKTTTGSGGRIVGFSNNQTILSTSYDRHIYMINSGQLIFGVYPTVAKTVTSPLSYNDGRWHYVVGTLSVSGLQLYVDSINVATDTTTTSAQIYNGYWRWGDDTLSGWPSAPTSDSFAGTLQEAAVYMNARLTPTQITSHYVAGLGD